jgi:photosystem II stability/assembly factor-like uncharacterized protein
VQHSPSSSRRLMNLPWASRLGQVAIALFSFALVALGVPLARQEGPTGLWVQAGLEGAAVLRIMATSGSSGVRVALVAGRGIYRSTDGGMSWTALTSGLPVDAWGRVNVRTLAMSQENPAVMYAGMTEAGGQGNTENAGLYVTDNGGASWRGLARDMAGKSVQAIALSTSVGIGTATVCVGANDGIYCSGDQGQTWSRLGWRGVETRITCLTFSPVATGTLYVGTDGYGLYGTVDGGASWKEMNEGLGSQDIYDIAVSAEHSDVVYVGTSDGAYRTDDSGVSWATLGEVMTGRSVLAITVSDGPSTVLYTGIQRGAAFRSTDGGEHWESIRRGLGDLTVYSILVDPGNPSVIWAGTSDGVWRCVMESPSSGSTLLPAALATLTAPEAPATLPAIPQPSPTQTPTVTVLQPATSTLAASKSPTSTNTTTRTVPPTVTSTSTPSSTATPTLSATSTRTPRPVLSATPIATATLALQPTESPTSMPRPRPTETRIKR